MSKRYTKEYKSEAIKLSEEIGSSEASKKLGVSDWTVRRWKKEAGTNTKAENAESSKRLATENRELQEKIKEMEKEIARIKKENEFLEDAASFFAASRQKSKQS
jgi:transposase